NCLGSISVAFSEYAAIDFPRIFISLFGLCVLRGRDLGSLLAPALVHGLKAPLGAAARCADRLAPDQYKDPVGVRRRKDSQGDPTASFDGNIKPDVTDSAIGDNGLLCCRLAVDD